MATRRNERVNALLQEAIAAQIVRGIKDPRVAGVTITCVDASPDLRQAAVYYRVLGDETARARVQGGLERAAGYIQSVVGRELRLRYTPTLRFVFDPTLDVASRVEALLAGTVSPDVDDSLDG
jgi:ribosome-binding factor A